jgi:uncharacterized protein YndB with AHSA1/START domain
VEIDIAGYVGAVSRQVLTRDKDGKPARVVVASRAYDTTPEDLWDALTNPERIPRWFMPIDGDLRLGGRYALTGNASGTIIACEPPKHLGVTWEFMGDTSWVDVRIAPHAQGAHLTLEHLSHVHGDWWEQFGPGATGVGWDLSLMGLALHLLGPENALDPKAAEAWALTPNGKAFSDALAGAWCDAAIRGGDDPKAAREAAARTAAFYKGEGPGAGHSHEPG